jgi:phosphohistidine phosphatase
MNLFLMQHGEATSEQDNPERPLTPAGRGAVESVALRAQHAGVLLDRCFHSGKLRAAQSAELLAAAVGGILEQRDGLAPNDPIIPVADWVRRVDESIALVGHLPFLGRLASLLIVGDENVPVVRFTMGGLVCLVHDEPAQTFVVAWALSPAIS